MPDVKKLKGPNNPSEGRPDPNPTGDKPRLASPVAPPEPPKDLKNRLNTDPHRPQPSGKKPSGG
jgi:hypothetical protein